MNVKAVGYAVYKLGVLDHTGVVAGVLRHGGVDLEVAPAVERGLVDPGGLLALEEPAGERGAGARVPAGEMDLRAPAEEYLRPDVGDLRGVP